MQKKPNVRWEDLIARYDDALDWLQGLGVGVAGSRFTEGRKIIVDITERYPHAAYDKPLVRDPLARKFAVCLDEAIEVIHIAEAFRRLSRQPMGIKPRLKEMIDHKEEGAAFAFGLLLSALFETAAYVVDLRQGDLWACWTGEPDLAVEGRRVDGAADLALAIRTAASQLERRTRSRPRAHRVLALGIGRSKRNDPLVPCAEGRGDMARESQSRAYEFVHRHRQLLDMELARADIAALLLLYGATFGTPVKTEDELSFVVTPYIDMEVRPGNKALEASPFFLTLQRRLGRAIWRLCRDGQGGPATTTLG